MCKQVKNKTQAIKYTKYDTKFHLKWQFKCSLITLLDPFHWRKCSLENTYIKTTITFFAVFSIKWAVSTHTHTRQQQFKKQINKQTWKLKMAMPICNKIFHISHVCNSIICFVSFYSFCRVCVCAPARVKEWVIADRTMIAGYIPIYFTDKKFGGEVGHMFKNTQTLWHIGLWIASSNNNENSKTNETETSWRVSFTMEFKCVHISAHRHWINKRLFFILRMVKVLPLIKLVREEMCVFVFWILLLGINIDF